MQTRTSATYRLAVITLAGMALFGLTSSSMLSQEQRQSPVFKDYVPPGSPLLMTRSDATYRLWQTLVLTRKANAGDPVAQHELGVRYLVGKEVPADTVQGAYWVGRAAALNYLPARFNLGILYYYGWGMSWDPFKAYSEFLYCSEKGMFEADYILSQFYLEDLVVPRDEKEAYRRLTKAVDGGYEPAKPVLERLRRSIEISDADSSRSSGDQIARTDSLFGPVFLDLQADSTAGEKDNTVLNAILRELVQDRHKGANGGSAGVIDTTGMRQVERLADVGSPEALTVLGRLYEKGQMVEADVVISASYYLRAIRLGSGQAYELLWKSAERKGFFAQLKSRSARGDAVARFVWAGLHAFGLDMLADVQVRVTDHQAFRLLRESADASYVPALNEIGLCYFSGRWVEQDREQALEYWQRAMSSGSGEARIRIAMVQVREYSDEATVREAISTLKAGSDSGSVLADAALGYCYESGTGVEVSKGKAAWFYRRGASRGSRDAHIALLSMHDAIRPPDGTFLIDSMLR
jgi:hypothetical protein